LVYAPQDASSLFTNNVKWRSNLCCTQDDPSLFTIDVKLRSNLMVLPFHHQCEMEKQFAFVKLCCDILFGIYSHDDVLCFSLSFMIQKSCTPFGALGEFPFKKKQCCILHSALTSLRKFMLHFVGLQFWY